MGGLRHAGDYHVASARARRRAGVRGLRGGRRGRGRRNPKEGHGARNR